MRSVLTANILIATCCVIISGSLRYNFFKKAPELNDDKVITVNKGHSKEHNLSRVSGLSVLRDNLQSDNIVGLLKIEGANIFYPVVQFSDNAYYLQHNILGEYDESGSIFMDYENDVLAEDKNIIIYGHNMQNGTKFHNLRFYKEEAFYIQNKYITLETADGVSVWEVFTVFVTDVNFYYIQVHFGGHNEFAKLLKQMRARSLYETHTTASSGDRILTLSTCDTEEDKRLVISAKLVGRL